MSVFTVMSTLCQCILINKFYVMNALAFYSCMKTCRYFSNAQVFTIKKMVYDLFQVIFLAILLALIYMLDAYGGMLYLAVSVQCLIKHTEPRRLCSNSFSLTWLFFLTVVFPE